MFRGVSLVGLRLEPSVREELFQLRGPLLPLQQVVGLPCFAVVRCPSWATLQLCGPVLSTSFIAWLAAARL